MLAQLEHVVARNLRVVGRKVARLLTLIAMDRALPVGFDRQVAPATARGPAKVAGEAGHLAVLVGAVAFGDAGPEGEGAIFRARAAHQLGARGLEVEQRVGGIDRVLHQPHLPHQLGIDDRTLIELAPAAGAGEPFEPALTIRIAQQRQVVTPGRRGRAAGHQRRVLVRRPVAIDAAYLDRIGHLAIDQPIAVAVLREVTIGALHALFGVNVHQVDRFAGVGAGRDELPLPAAPPLLRVVRVDDVPGVAAHRCHVAPGVEQVPRAVALEHPAEVPAVSVVVGELRIEQQRVQIVDIAQEL